MKETIGKNMKIEEIKKRVNDLIEQADLVLKTQQSYEHVFGIYLSSEDFSQFRSLCLSFLNSVFGEEHIFYKEFHAKVISSSPSSVEIGKGILRAAKQEIENGWIFNVRTLLSADIFSDFLEMANYLLTENYKDSAAVMIGSVLEGHLRNLCNKYSISLEKIKDDKSIPKTADSLNHELKAANVYNLLDQKQVIAWLDLRNKAAHGKYDDYTKSQVELMYQGVLNFISRIN